MAGIELQIRVSDCDSFGHVNNAVFVTYIQHALAFSGPGQGIADGWRRESPCRWQLKSMHVEYRQPVVPGDRLSAAIWLADPNQLNPMFGCDIIRPGSEEGQGADPTIVRSQSSWVLVSRQTGLPIPIPHDLLENLPKNGGRLPRTFKPVSAPEGLRRYCWDHQVMRSEVSPDSLVHPQVIYQWIEEGIFNASAEAGWPFQRCLASGFVVYTIRHDTEFLAFPALGDRIQITNRLIDVRRLKGTWLNEIRRESDNVLLVRNYATGVFLDIEGRPATPPDQMMETVQFGSQQQPPEANR